EREHRREQGDLEARDEGSHERLVAQRLAEPAHGEAARREAQGLAVGEGGRDDEQDRHDHDDVAGDREGRGDGVAGVHAVAPFRPTKLETADTTDASAVMRMAVALAPGQSIGTLEYVNSCVASMRLPDPPSRYGVV